MDDKLVLKVSGVTAVLGSVALSAFFVVSLYLWKLAGYSDTNRDHTETIQRRFLSACLSCVCSAVLVYVLSMPAGPTDSGMSLTELLGVQVDDLGRACIHCLSLTAILFIGPLAQHVAGVIGGSALLVSMPGGPWVALRNYVLAPFTEEFVFRACLVRLWVSAAFPMAVVIFCSPFCFAMAHAHHFIEHVRHGRNKSTAIMQVAFQVFYTSLFGMYSNYLLIRTGSTVAVIMTHTFCNHQGFPDLAFLVSGAHPLFPHRHWLGALYIVGMVAFCWYIVPFTAGFESTFAYRSDELSADR